jgi:hypothetical protein
LSILSLPEFFFWWNLPIGHVVAPHALIPGIFEALELHLELSLLSFLLDDELVPLLLVFSHFAYII